MGDANFHYPVPLLVANSLPSPFVVGPVRYSFPFRSSTCHRSTTKGYSVIGIGMDQQQMKGPADHQTKGPGEISMVPLLLCRSVQSLCCRPLDHIDNKGTS